MGDEPLYGPEEAPAPRWRSAFTWTGLAGAALVVYEFTNQPALGAAVLCLKFGWEDFKTAAWLMRVDPVKARGRACWWLYVGWGRFKATGAGFFVSFATLGVLAFLQEVGKVRAPGAMDSALTGAAAAMLVAWCLCTTATLCMVWRARHHRLKLWLHESVSSARRRRVWPPYDPEVDWPTHGLAVPTRQAMLVMVSAPFAMTPLVAMPLLENWIGLVLGLGGAACGAYCWAEAVRSVSADTPTECWPPDELAAPPDDGVQ
jgi:hypothetical protein